MFWQLMLFLFVFAVITSWFLAWLAAPRLMMRLVAGLNRRSLGIWFFLTLGLASAVQANIVTAHKEKDGTWTVCVTVPFPCPTPPCSWTYCFPVE